MKKIIFLLILLAAGSISLRGQSLEMFKEQLQQPDARFQSRVIVREHDAAATIVRTLQVRPSGEKIRGYRIRIFFDNSQNARSLAESTRSRFREIYPDIPAYINYESPYFKVAVGNCITSEEAIILWGRIKDAFDRAFVIREDIPLSALGTTVAADTSTSD